MVEDEEAAMVREMVAKAAITEALYRYCRSMDRMDRDLALGCWHEGATVDYVDIFQGTGSGFVEWVWTAHQPMLRHSHQITNILVEVTGDRACSEAYVTAVLWAGPESRPVEIVTRGRYLDAWSRRDGRWAIDRRIYLTDLMSTTPLPDTALAAVSAPSHRDTDDPSYALFSGR